MGVVGDVDGLGVLGRAVVSELEYLLDPGNGCVPARGFEWTPAQYESVLHVVFGLDLEAVGVQGERLHYDVLQKLGPVEGVLLGVFLERKCLFVKHTPSWQHGGLFQSEFPHEVLSADAEVFVFDRTLLVLLEPVRNVPGVQFDGQGNCGLFGLPFFLFRHWNFAWILACLAGLGVTRFLKLNVALTFEPADRGHTGLFLGLGATAADVVANTPVA